MKRRCHSCEMLNINGVATHEIGCPEAWKDEIRECKWCGTEFVPESKWQECCCEDCFECYTN